MQLAGVCAKASELLQGGAAATGKRCRQTVFALYEDGVHLHLLVGLSGHALAVRRLCWDAGAVLLLHLDSRFGNEGCHRWRGGRSARANWLVEHLGKIGGQRRGGGRWRGRRDRWCGQRDRWRGRRD
eukprot:scaffold73503_cov69-Phaeocystis_antarctica.AAC.1